MTGYAGGGFAGSTPWFVRQEAHRMVPEGMLGGSGLGRDDQLPISVPSGSYIVPSDVVSGIGQGNSAAGAAILNRAFHSGPLGMPAMHMHGGFGGPHNVRMGMAKLPRGAGVGSVLTQTKSPGFQRGGYAHGGMHASPPGHTPIVAASGEFIVHPSAVLRIGRGDLKKGHDVLDELIKQLRAKHIKQQRQLPPPVKRAG
jgi:hypothetical protein